ncbi:glycoside hydrolase family 35 protein [Aplosporella prunicola CBS 121167]|uniref:Beta-galactosidase n=1 Tax=Aplosporella prunicola CBS 121167 TaxID=1176127 RepID=A0A6A6BT68_9PEZI|nr:glycoside hydrolase family 35 protein [Aplosporella prunicola CBS 121167]KAF2145801.1 glycoside hydrolase family 35 protein [Aplosporella prunicola CBS 121167]
MKFGAGLLVLATLASQTLGLAIGGKPHQMIKPYKRELLQDIVTWDEHSLFVNGERIVFLSGEFHPYRLPVPSLWLDIFQKIKGLGFNGVSFYVDWALLEGKPGEFSAEGIFAWEPFFEAATQAGIYLIARPGPYINAEVSGGGFPGWLQRNQGILRTNQTEYLEATDLYVQSISEIIAPYQITEGGPVILLQPENEYSGATDDIKFPDPDYIAYVEEQYRKGGFVVPTIANDAGTNGYLAPDTPSGFDIYGHDGYPLGFDCANPYTWPDGKLPTNWRSVHLATSPETPYSIVEFQGGAFDPWGGPSFGQCEILLNNEFERVFYKNNYGFGITLFNIYMIFGGTNWGNLGHPGGYTSYDYGSVIKENRVIDREKYSELKLQGNFIQASPAYLTAVPANGTTNGTFTGNPALTVTPLFGEKTNFFVIRHSAYNSLDSTSYRITLPTSAGNITVPQLNGTLSLNGRDSKFHVTDYDVGDYNLLYSTAEIFTQKKYDDKTVLVVYGGPEELHELAFSDATGAKLVEGSGVTIASKNGATVLNWKTTTSRRIVKVEDDLYVYILDRNSAYDYWVVYPADGSSTPYTGSAKSNANGLIVQAGYLLRNVTVSDGTIALVGDVNATTPVEIIGGASSSLKTLTFNGEPIPFNQTATGSVLSSVSYDVPNFDLPDLSTVTWKYLDTLPEITDDYSDDAWNEASLTETKNTLRKLTTPTSLYGSDYGYHTGTLLFRGHFTATGAEKTLYVSAEGGSAFGFSAWLNGTFLGSFAGYDAASIGNATFTLPTGLEAEAHYVITVVVDNMGLNEDWTVGTDEMKNPRGVLAYELDGHDDQADVTWKLAGNLGGEDFKDKTRGPLNEGGLFAERNGFHLPGAPSEDWEDAPAGGPLAGIDEPGVAFYATSFDLALPSGWDIPLSFVFGNASEASASASASASAQKANGTASATAAYRVQFFVNGFQFGKYVHNVGPQDAFPVPPGVLDYSGPNYVALSLWALEEGGARLESLELVAGTPVKSGFGDVAVLDVSQWSEREGAF